MYIKKEELNLLKEIDDLLYDLIGEDNNLYIKFNEIIERLEARFNKRNNYAANYMYSKRNGVSKTNIEEIDFENLGI